ncbi:hypothetical protein ACR79N_10115 [Sphingobacterium siyangense]|uniref:Uncharacterized protein n=1 Tax=Sphingobacterium siyangense TaxID=459529 RepID=A0A562M248_9SPHI|nr:hypothetical protein [Sphingobacterium siyangense]TWI13999.1 hypothetical protein IQ31_05374 [Sphingobacterium siyangense]
METKYHVKEPEDKQHVLELHRREMESFFRENKMWILKNKLGKMTSRILSYRVSQKDYTDFIEKVKYLVNFGWELVFQENRYGIGFALETEYYVKNPFFLKREFQSAEFRQRNYGLSGFYGEVTSLSVKEASDIYRTLQKFYDEISVVSWLNLLDDWLWVVEEQGSLYEITRIDKNPIQTQLLISKLIEALYLFSRSDFLIQAIKYPTTHLFSGPKALMHMDYDILDTYNPYFWLEDLFKEKTAADYIKHLQFLYEPEPENQSKKLPNRKLFDLGVELKILIQVTWMNIQCQFLPQEWTNVIDADVDAEELNLYIQDQLHLISPNKPIKLQELFAQLFQMDWKMTAYKCTIDEMVERKICGINSPIHFVLCKIDELELLIKVCYLMHLKIKVKKNWGQLRII